MSVEFKVSKKRGKAKIKISAKRERAMKKLTESYSEEVDVKLAVIQELIPLGLREVAKELQNEVKNLVGRRCQRGTDNVRWGKQNGSVYLRDQKFPVFVPRVRNSKTNTEIPLEAYQQLQEPFIDDGQTVMKLLHGLSTHRYEESSSLAAEAFGLSASNLLKRFKENTAELLRKLQTRSLESYDFVCVFIDGKRYADQGLMVAMGVTLEGKKVFLGIEQIHSENSRAIEQWIDKLITRGLKFDEGILFITDGSKGIIKAVERRLDEYAVLQRCRWHKRENVLSYLDDAQRELCKHRMKQAYKKTTYKEAKDELQKLHRELRGVNQSAANSLAEGLEETLTLHTLGLSPELTKSLGSTNPIESVMSQLGQYTDKVDRWHNSDQIMRWTAATLLDTEPRLFKIRGFRYLKVLRYKLKEIVKKRQEKRESMKQPEMVGV